MVAGTRPEPQTALWPSPGTRRQLRHERDGSSSSHRSRRRSGLAERPRHLSCSGTAVPLHVWRSDGLPRVHRRRRNPQQLHLPDERGQQRPLSHAELTSVGQQLYALLRTFTGYQAAIVGWNAEWVVEFAGDYFPHPRSGPDELASIEGLVLATDLYDRWGAWETWQPFTDGYRWLPYEGDRTS